MLIYQADLQLSLSPQHPVLLPLILLLSVVLMRNGHILSFNSYRYWLNNHIIAIQHCIAYGPVNILFEHKMWNGREESIALCVTLSISQPLC